MKHRTARIKFDQSLVLFAYSTLFLEIAKPVRKEIHINHLG